MLVSAIARLSLQLARQHSFLKKNMYPVLQEARLGNDGSLSGSDFKKITHYYGWAVPAVLGEAFCAWRGTPMTETERACSTAQGAMTGLFDDFFDQTMLTDEAIGTLMSASSGIHYRDMHEKLFRRFFSEALTQSPSPKQMQEALSVVYADQVLSRRQADPSISTDEIKDISLRKGGSSLLFYRTAFEPAADEKEKSILYTLGGLMQISNDIFDIYKDREAGIFTLATRCVDIRSLRDFFENSLQQIFRELSSVHLPASRKHRFASIINLGIFSRVFVCLDQLEALQEKTGGHFQLQNYKRKELICDMEKPRNLLASARYYRKCMKEIK